MNWTAVAIETVTWCLFFTILMIVLCRVMFRKKNYAMASLSYPPAIVERLIAQGKIKEEKPLPLGRRLAKKLPILIFYIIAFTCLLYFVNGCRSFLTGFLSCFIIMIVWTWYDALVLDGILFCHTKLFVIEGTEDMVEAYHDFLFHVKASLVGTALSLFGSLAIGGIIALISLF